MFKTLKDFSVSNKRILVRCDFDVPIDEKGEILDDFRIKKALSTIKYLIDSKARIILMGHLGRPEGKIVPQLKLDKIAQRIADFVGFSIGKEDDCIGPEIETETQSLRPGQILVLENLRFHKEETENNSDFAKKLSFLGDIYVNEAFAVCHRDQASVTGVPQYLPSCAGFLLEKEINSLDKILKDPEKPMIAIVGGKKVETKAAFINNISKVADFVIVSGLIAKEIKDKKISFKFPEKIISPVGQLDSPDINDKSIKIFCEKIKKAKTILWNGPFGKFEEKNYAKGTLEIAQAIIESEAFSVVGGGETVEFLNKNNMIDKFNHVSTGGGAMLAYLAGAQLPGIEALKLRA